MYNIIKFFIMGDIDYFIGQVMWTNFIMFIWFNTDAFVDYLSWTKKFKLKEYKEYTQLNKRLPYPDFLFLTKPFFITKLLSCRPCLHFWIVLSTGLYFNFSSLAGVYITSYAIYKLLQKYVY
jgi:hypothetical protein